jgi:hypothetical protein
VPLAHSYPENDLFHKWVYIVDLDREHFHVRVFQEGAWRFALDSVPHGALWLNHEWSRHEFGSDDNDGLAKIDDGVRQHEERPISSASGGSIVCSNRDTAACRRLAISASDLKHGADDNRTGPDGGAATCGSRNADNTSLVGNELKVCFANSGPASFRLETAAHMTAAVEPQPLLSASHVFRKLLFHRFLSLQNSVIANHIFGYTPDDAAYRETAFAMLSVAADDFTLLAADQKRIQPSKPHCISV